MHPRLGANHVPMPPETAQIEFLWPRLTTLEACPGSTRVGRGQRSAAEGMRPNHLAPLLGVPHLGSKLSDVERA
jgi:hypothetical protein